MVLQSSGVLLAQQGVLREMEEELMDCVMSREAAEQTRAGGLGYGCYLILSSRTRSSRAQVAGSKLKRERTNLYK